MKIGHPQFCTFKRPYLIFFKETKCKTFVN
nr:MAG TPA: hypothetical protein [Caudoviricetes sp.]